jgi:hypothetical protein
MITLANFRTKSIPVLFSDLKEGEFFSHYFSENSTGVYRKKKHTDRFGAEKHSICLETGSSFTTGDQARCYIVDVEATITYR